MAKREEALTVAAELQALGYWIPGKKVVVLRDTPEEKIGALFVPDTARQQKLAGTIVMIGEEIKADPQYAKLSVGQWATFNKYNGILHEVKLTDRKVMVEVMYVTDIYIVGGEGDQSPFDSELEG